MLPADSKAQGFSATVAQVDAAKTDTEAARDKAGRSLTWSEAAYEDVIDTLTLAIDGYEHSLTNHPEWTDGRAKIDSLKALRSRINAKYKELYDSLFDKKEGIENDLNEQPNRHFAFQYNPLLPVASKINRASQICAASLAQVGNNGMQRFQILSNLIMAKGYLGDIDSEADNIHCLMTAYDFEARELIKTVDDSLSPYVP